MTELAQEHISEAQQKQKSWYDHTTRMRELKPNDQMLVLLLTTHNKLLAKWQGPYKVVCRIGKVAYEVSMPGARKRKKVFDINLLKKWFEPEETAFMVGNSEIGEDDDIYRHGEKMVALRLQ